MSVSKNKIWYNYWMPPYQGLETPFYESENDSLFSAIENRFIEVENEIRDLITNHAEKLKPYFVSSINKEKSNWTTLTIQTWGIQSKQVVHQCPKTMEIFESIPGFLSLAISKLNAGSKIPAHCGDTNAIYRCHIGVEIPASLPDCGIRVKDEKRSWIKGKTIAFVDAFEHETWNNSNQDRIILIFDVVKKDFLRYKRSICFNVRAFMLLQKICERRKWISNAPKFLHRILFFKIKILLYILYPYQVKKGLILK